MKNTFAFLIVSSFFLIATGQNLTITITFSALNDSSYIRLDSVRIINRSWIGDTTIRWPDTSLTMSIISGNQLLYIGYAAKNPVGIQWKIADEEYFQVFQNYPNPIIQSTRFIINIPWNGLTTLTLTDINGRQIKKEDYHLSQGFHTFSFMPGTSRVYFLLVQWNKISRGIIMINANPENKSECTLQRIDQVIPEQQFKNSSSIQYSEEESGITDKPQNDTGYIFQFATNIPCPGIPTINYSGQIYNTIQIFSQCWLKENLNVGTMILGSQDMTNNSIIEKYCYNDEPDSCAIYGGLYQWDEMMNYNTAEGTRGICPPDWHIPTDEEWKILEGAVDNQIEIGNIVWDNNGWRGFDVGYNLKSTNGWYLGGNGADLFDFRGLPGGLKSFGANFGSLSQDGYWWTSTEWSSTSSRYRRITYDTSKIERNMLDKVWGVSIRCLRDH